MNNKEGGGMKAAARRTTLAAIRDDEADLIVGTHAILSEGVEFARLGLAVVDEQHRFGVRQRGLLAEKAANPHLLVMSATPIPRTLAIILYGDLDISIIDEMPAERLPVKNCVVNTGYRDRAYQFIAREIAAGRQAYVICPMVEESEMIEAENVLDYTKLLREKLPAGITVEYMHGKMKGKEKNKISHRGKALRAIKDELK